MNSSENNWLGGGTEGEQDRYSVEGEGKAQVLHSRAWRATEKGWAGTGRDAAECEHRERTHDNRRERNLAPERTGGCRQKQIDAPPMQQWWRGATETGMLPKCQRRTRDTLNSKCILMIRIQGGSCAKQHLDV